ncbi:MAG: hypothetical protein ACKVPX_09575 [Myxococcaceae bacterium]
MLPEHREHNGAALAEIEAEIVRAHANLAAHVTALQHTIVRTIDWRSGLGRHPFVFLGSALGLGYLMGRRF